LELLVSRLSFPLFGFSLLILALQSARNWHNKSELDTRTMLL
jgi:hypothetical protein